MAKTLIIFYSRDGQNYVGGQITSLAKGNARKIVDYLREALPTADVFEVKTVDEYPADYMATTEVAQEELRQNARPALVEMLEGIADYDTVILCGPCWWGTYPMAMFTQLEALDFAGKKVLPIMTHEGSGLGSVERDLKKLCQGADIAKGLAVRGGDTDGAKEQVVSWVQKNL